MIYLDIQQLLRYLKKEQEDNWGCVGMAYQIGCHQQPKHLCFDTYHVLYNTETDAMRTEFHQKLGDFTSDSTASLREMEVLEQKIRKQGFLTIDEWREKARVVESSLFKNTSHIIEAIPQEIVQNLNKEQVEIIGQIFETTVQLNIRDMKVIRELLEALQEDSKEDLADFISTLTVFLADVYVQNCPVEETNLAQMHQEKNKPKTLTKKRKIHPFFKRKKKF